MSTTEISKPVLPLAVESRPNRVPTWVKRLASPILLILVWEFAVLGGLLDGKVIAPPHQIPLTIAELWEDGSFQAALLTSSFRAISGLLLGTVLGAIAALIAGLWRFGHHTVDPIARLLLPIPATGLITLAILVFGIGEFTKISLVAFATFFPVYTNTLHGIRSVDPKFVELAAVAGLRRKGLILTVLIPSALPSFFVGLRFSASISWLLLVVVEQLNSTAGLGFLLTEAQRYFRTDIIMTALLFYGILGLLSDALVVGISKLVLPWRKEYDGS
ncbi:ABC transporter permease [Leucobacter weissii]|uniref:ABC transporter permease n=1 Tax=Leucobacter weissii TaxID=1983706 RepID=A0A939MK90_9MICO|nr:ABC transporter permease [Leucobacter weissii]MBO1901775.1 ABC transporter permease [Leucobacter weissii]